MLKRLFILFSLLIAVPVSGAADHVMPFLAYDVSDGLSNNTVNAVMQDETGYIWVGTSSGLDRFDGVRFRHYDVPPVTVLSEDADDEIWVGTSSGLYHFSQDGKSLERFVTETCFNVMISSAVNDIEVEADGNIWIATEGQGVFLYSKETGTLSQFSRYISIVTSIDLLDEGCLLVCAEAGQISKLTQDGEIVPLFSLNSSEYGRRELRINNTFRKGSSFWIAPEQGRMVSFNSNEVGGAMSLQMESGIDIRDVTGIIGFTDGFDIIGTTSGLYLCDFEKESFRQIICRETQEVFNRHVTCLFKDRENGIWVGTSARGVYYIPYSSKPVEFKDLSKGKNSYAVTCFATDASGNLLIGTQEGGLFIQRKGHEPILLNGNIQNIQCVLAVGSKILVGTSDNGLYELNGEYVRNYRYDRYDSQSIMANNVTVLYRSGEGTVWVGTEWGLCRFNMAKGIFVPIAGDAGKANISCMYEDATSKLWVGTTYGRIIRTGPWRRVWSVYRSAVGNDELGKISCIHEDFNGKIRVGSNNGLFVFEQDKNSFIKENIFIPDLNLNNSISAIEQDTKGNLWLSGNFGVVGLDMPDMHTGQYLISRNDSGGNVFISNSSFKTEDGRIFFGGTGGYYTFQPESFGTNVYAADVVISEVDVNGSPIDDEALSSTGKTVLSNDENNLSFGFSILSWQNPRKNRYYYKLEGWDSDWTFAGETAFVKYENLPSGVYCFKVKGENNDGVSGSNVAEYPFVIRIPWYFSWYAIVSYLLIVFIICVFFYSWRRRRKDRMAFQSKLQSYTNFAQDVRVPVTLIKTPLQNMLSSYELPDHVRTDLEIMKRSSDNLLDTIDQLLDYSNNEQSVSELEVLATDIVSLVEESVLRFKPMADTKDITIETVLPDKSSVYDLDSKAMTKVMGNLLSNAVKYAENVITVRLEAEKDGFRIMVDNDGPPIPVSEQEKIFGMFYQGDDSMPGTGMGLALARMLVERHGGELKMVPAQTGASFGIFMPLPQLDEKAEIAFVQDDSHMDVILVLDDSHEMRKLMSSILSPYYKIISSSGGEKGFEMLESNLVNLIICDVDMPDMSGFDFCSRIRGDHRFADIPFIFITAKVNMKDKVHGLEMGADDYIEKPFDPEWLKARIRSLLLARNRLKDFYKGLPGVHPMSVSALTNADMEFINKLTSVISGHIADESFYVDDLAEAMFLSKSSLYRKVKALLDVSPVDYIKKVRLHKAAEMLSKGEFAVYEVWQKVGFSSLTYFATCFKKEFGITPSKYANSLKENQDEV